MNNSTMELMQDLKTYKAIVRVMDENKKGYLERISTLEVELNSFKSVGRASQMPGSSGFTMACFCTKDVPVDCDVYIKGDM
jgi:hypothetical protein